MSREFRWVDGSYLHDALQAASEVNDARHEVSRALSPIYAVLAKIECAAAGFEAGDTSWGQAALGLLQNCIALADAHRDLQEIASNYSSMAAAIIRNKP